MFLTLAIIVILAALVYRGYLFVDFQFQVGSFVWGRRLGIKRRSVAAIAAAQRLGEAFKKLDAIGEPPMTSQEVQTEIDAARVARASEPAFAKVWSNPVDADYDAK